MLTFCDGRNRRAATLSHVRVCLVLFLSAVFIGLMPACGKKGPPFLPENRLDAGVDALTGTWTDGEIRLEGTIQGADKGADITGCVVYHAFYPMDEPPCEGCPIEMTRFPAPVDATVSEGGLICTIPVSEKSGIWFWEVRLTDSRGAVGPPSERIRLEMQE